MATFLKIYIGPLLKEVTLLDFSMNFICKKKTFFVKTSRVRPKSAPKKAHSAKKKPKGRTRWSPLYFWKHNKTLWFSARDRQTFAKPWDPNIRVRNERSNNSSIASISLFLIFRSISTNAFVYQVATVM